MKKLMVLLGLIVLVGVLPVPSAVAETNPACPSGVEQIGTTGYVVENGVTFASVKQFKGCGRNWGYIYVWESWRNSHSNWDMCVSVVIDEGAEDTPVDMKCVTDSRRAELWSGGAYTLSDCTYAIGLRGTYQNPIRIGRTSTRC